MCIISFNVWHYTFWVGRVLSEWKNTSKYFFQQPSMKFTHVINSPELSKMIDLRHTNSSPCRFIIRKRVDVASNMSKISTMPSTHLPWFLWKQIVKSIKGQKSFQNIRLTFIKIYQVDFLLSYWLVSHWLLRTLYTLW
jgi:hypothetical protein